MESKALLRAKNSVQDEEGAAGEIEIADMYGDSDESSISAYVVPFEENEKGNKI